MLADILIKIADVVVTLFIYLVLARVLLQLCKADRYNPIAQSVVRFTDPFLGPLRKALPKSVRWDFAGVLVLLALGVLRALVNSGFTLAAVGIGPLLLFAVIGLVMTVIDLYLLLILVMVVLSFVAPGSYHPGAVLVRQLTDPLLAPIQRMMPSMGGIDLSPLIAGTALYILRDIVLPNLLA